jgi:hypothetical protein
MRALAGRRQVTHPETAELAGARRPACPRRAVASPAGRRGLSVGSGDRWPKPCWLCGANRLRSLPLIPRAWPRRCRHAPRATPGDSISFIWRKGWLREISGKPTFERFQPGISCWRSRPDSGSSKRRSGCPSPLPRTRRWRCPGSPTERTGCSAATVDPAIPCMSGSRTSWSNSTTPPLAARGPYAPAGGCRGL